MRRLVELSMGGGEESCGSQGPVGEKGERVPGGSRSLGGGAQEVALAGEGQAAEGGGCGTEVRERGGRKEFQPGYRGLSVAEETPPHLPFPDGVRQALFLPHSGDMRE